jgi:hypothetical protein
MSLSPPDAKVRNDARGAQFASPALLSLVFSAFLTLLFPASTSTCALRKLLASYLFIYITVVAGNRKTQTMMLGRLWREVMTCWPDLIFKLNRCKNLFIPGEIVQCRSRGVCQFQSRHLHSLGLHHCTTCDDCCA